MPLTHTWKAGEDEQKRKHERNWNWIDEHKVQTWTNDEKYNSENPFEGQSEHQDQK